MCTVDIRVISLYPALLVPVLGPLSLPLIAIGIRAVREPSGSLPLDWAGRCGNNREPTYRAGHRRRCLLYPLRDAEQHRMPRRIGRPDTLRTAPEYKENQLFGTVSGLQSRSPSGKYHDVPAGFAHSDFAHPVESSSFRQGRGIAFQAF